MPKVSRPRGTVGGVKAYQLCKGSGLEIGALSTVFDLDAVVEYADIGTKEEMARLLAKAKVQCYALDDLVEVTHVLRPPFYNFPHVHSGVYDFVCSSHYLEHHPNPGFSIAEQLRIVKPHGIVYTIIPNKEECYDIRRVTTSPALLMDRFLHRKFDLDLTLVLDCVLNTQTHPQYAGRGVEYAEEIMRTNEGFHHLFVFDPGSTMDFLVELRRSLHFDILYFDTQGIDIHFALRKPG